MRKNFESEVRAFASRLQLKFKKTQILKAALTHPSFLDSDEAEDIDMTAFHNTKLSLLGKEGVLL